MSITRDEQHVYKKTKCKFQHLSPSVDTHLPTNDLDAIWIPGLVELRFVFDLDRLTASSIFSSRLLKVLSDNQRIYDCELVFNPRA